MSMNDKDFKGAAFPVSTNPGGTIKSLGLNKRELASVYAMSVLGPHMLAKGETSHAKIAIESIKLADMLLKKIELDPSAYTVASGFEFFKMVDGKKRKANKMEVLKKGENVEYVLEITNDDGEAAVVEGVPTWSSSPEGFVEIKASDDGLSAVVTRIGPSQKDPIQVNVVGDADLGEGVREIIGTALILLPSAEATTIKLVPKAKA